jgi:hypothetical protein
MTAHIEKTRHTIEAALVAASLANEAEGVA